MTKKEIVTEVMDNADLPRLTAVKAFDVMVEAIKQSLTKGEDVYIRGFATLKMVRTKARVSGFNGKEIPATNTVKIKISKELKKRMNNE